jgi:Family of unknown function (DUF5330)
MRILRTIFVLSGITVFMPSPPEGLDQATQGLADAKVSETGYFEVATNTFSDLAAFCERQPGVCVTAGFVAHKLELKAKYGVRLIYEWANEASTVPAAAVQPEIAKQVDPFVTGTIQLASTKPRAKISQSTLHLDDLIPVWRGPASARSS